MQSLSLQEAAKLLVDLKNDGIDVPPEVTAEVVVKVQNIIIRTEATGTNRIPAFEEIQDIFREVGVGFDGDSFFPLEVHGVEVDLSGSERKSLVIGRRK